MFKLDTWHQMNFGIVAPLVSREEGRRDQEKWDGFLFLVYDDIC